MSETWRAIPGYEGHYEVSDHGRVRSCKSHRPHKVLRTPPRKGPRPYAQVNLSIDGVPGMKLVHHLVALAFIGPRPIGQDIRHLDGDPSNNTLGNLAYGTRTENILDSVRHGTHYSGKGIVRRNKEAYYAWRYGDAS